MLQIRDSNLQIFSGTECPNVEGPVGTVPAFAGVLGLEHFPSFSVLILHIIIDIDVHHTTGLGRPCK